jgi:hypothetical protein
VVVYVYVVGAAGRDPSGIRCPVPWRVDEREIFFGACKKHLRELLRARFLGPGIAEATLTEDVWLVGLYPAGRPGPRHILFAGRLTRIMTFARAHDALVGSRYAKMRGREKSPIHLRPIYRSGALVGYDHRGQMHTEDEKWVTDLANRRSKNIEVEGDRILAGDGVSPWRAFPRDATFTLESLFWGPGQFLALDDEAVRLLKTAQPEVRMVSANAPFGLDRRGARLGRRGRYLTLRGKVGHRFVDWIRKRGAVS